MASRYIYVIEATPRGRAKKSPVHDVPWVTHHPTQRDAQDAAAAWDLERFRVSMYRYVKTAWPAQRQSKARDE